MSKIPENIADRFELEKLFSQLVVLWWDTKLCHWNINGHQFPSLHPLFDTQYNELDAWADKLAEHMRALGVKVPGSLSQYQDLANLKATDADATADEMVWMLKESYDQVRLEIQTVIVKQDDETAFVTIDLLTQIAAFCMHTSWLLGSSLPKHFHEHGGAHAKGGHHKKPHEGPHDKPPHIKDDV